MMALRLMRPLCAPLYWKIEGLMYHWLLAMVALWSWTAGYEILESGDEPAACGQHRTLVLANHQSTGDVPLLMGAWNPRAGVLANLMWIMDRIFKFTNFGIVSVLHEDFFIQACMQIIPERANVEYFNEKYVTDAKLNVRRYRRLGRYYMNLEMANQQPWNDNISVHFIFNEFLHNEYKPTFVEMHYKLCDMVNNNPYTGLALRRAGFECPTRVGRARRDASLEELRSHIVNSYIPLGRQFMVLFPEGGFLHKRREISQRFAEKNNLPKLEYVTLPRAGAMKIIMEEIGPQRNESSDISHTENSKRENHSTRTVSRALAATSAHLEWVLDVTIAYPDRVPLHLIQDVVCGVRPPCSVRLHYRIYPITEVPSDTEGMTQWLYDRFIEKDRMLEEYYRTGQFPSTTMSQGIRQVRQDNLRFLILHLFFIASTYVQYRLFYTVWCLLW